MGSSSVNITVIYCKVSDDMFRPMLWGHIELFVPEDEDIRSFQTAVTFWRWHGVRSRGTFWRWHGVGLSDDDMAWDFLTMTWRGTFWPWHGVGLSDDDMAWDFLTMTWRGTFWRWHGVRSRGTFWRWHGVRSPGTWRFSKTDHIRMT